MHAARSNRRRQRAAFVVLVALVLAGCGGSGISTDPPEAASTLNGVRPGVSPFIAFVDLDVPDLAGVKEAGFRIAPKPGTLSKPIQVEYTTDYLARRGFDDGSRRLSLPVFGLYAGYANDVDVNLDRHDGTTETLHASIQTQPYVDPNGIYDRPTFITSRTAGDSLGFDFMYLKSPLGSPVLIDTDGQLRWTVPGVADSQASMFYKDGFLVGSATSPSYQRVTLDGGMTTFQLDVLGVTDFHHDILPGKQGVLMEVDGNRSGTAILESILLEVDPDDGALLQQWDVAESVSRRMQAQGDDPAQFVRLGVDWFHMNSAIYDPTDDSLLVSGREDFVAKLDYESGDLRWILGDPTKYWHMFPSLATLNLNLAAGGLWPVGQHALSFTAGGQLMLFNDGQASFNQPAGEPAGEQRTFSAVSVYQIDDQARSATETRRFVHPDRLFSAICSSARETTAGGAMLIDYAVADGGTRLRLVGVNEDGSVGLDIAYPTVGCNSAWNAQPIALNDLRIE